MLKSLWVFLPLCVLGFVATSANEDCCEESCIDECSIIFPCPNLIAIGPEIYHVTRTREGGSKQTGWLYGGRLTYDRVKRYKFYWGIDALYATGIIDGHTGGGAKIKSNFTDGSIEGRFGYTFQQKSDLQPAFTPFVGYGYFRETNHFKSPSPMQLKYDIYFKYIAYGFLSSLQVTPAMIVGLNIKVMSMMDARCKISHDPDYKDQTLIINDETNYRVELPFHYLLNCWGNWDLACIPFYEVRHYGKRENYPFDFLDTHVRCYGFDLKIGFRF